MRGTKPADNAEAEPVLTPHQSHGLRSSRGDHVGREAVIAPGSSGANLQSPHHHADLPMGQLHVHLHLDFFVLPVYDQPECPTIGCYIIDLFKLYRNSG